VERALDWKNLPEARYSVVFHFDFAQRSMRGVNYKLLVASQDQEADDIQLGCKQDETQREQPELRKPPGKRI